VGILAYSFQLYFDFSGYSDMAIGLAAMMGFRFPENFDHPYVSRSIQEFWRRWHLSLSRWFRDYLYIPLGGNRVSPRRVYVNLVTVFFLCGLWHGAKWTFVAWGLYHGAFLVLERLGFDRVVARAPRLVGHGYALLAVMVGWVLFRADSLTAALGYLRAMAGLQGAVRPPFGVGFFLDPLVAVGLAAGLVGAGPWMGEAGRRLLATRPSRPGPRYALDAGITMAFALVFLAATLFIASSSYSPFIYFRF
jgi:alginate O-acetyltransferase complex protein AlgI